MALRTFRLNPSLGGFGGESSFPTRHNDRGSKSKSAKKRSGPSIEQQGHHDGDAFAQIVKELVDNAVDACSTACSMTPADDGDDDFEIKRVRVVIEPVDDQARTDNDDSKGDDHPSAEEQNDEVLRVTVTDNGCGMENIQDCVEAFRTSKAGAADGADSQTKATADTQEHTAGRYGIGLTLCLLHAQRLVPTSCASITSATTSADRWTRASFVVDTDNDKVRCVKKEHRPKEREDESGTSVSLLVPGGEAAHGAWPRLAEYFARFQLSLGLSCSLQVMAPSLSRTPLFIRPPLEVKRQRALTADPEPKTAEENVPDQEEEEAWNDGLGDCIDVSTTRNKMETRENIASKPNGAKAKPSMGLDVEGRRMDIQRAATNYLKRPVEYRNVACSIQPVRIEDPKTSVSRNGAKELRPMLEVDMIVCGPGGDDDTPEEEDPAESELQKEEDGAPDHAKIMLIRMVNRLPLLDGVEASACGLVRGVCEKRSTWSSFGLEVSPSMQGFGETSAASRQDISSTLGSAEPTPEELHIPTFALRDSVQVAPFFQSNTHSLFEMDDDENPDECEVEEEMEYEHGASRRRTKRTLLLPATLRLGNVLLIIHIHAKPSVLPLPTLSKGRIPMNNKPINDALENGLLLCLRSLQKTNPDLLLTSAQLRRTERDNRFVPAVAAALASIVSRSQNLDFQRTALRAAQTWIDGKKDVTAANTQTQLDESSLTSSPIVGSKTQVRLLGVQELDSASVSLTAPDMEGQPMQVETLGPIIESKLREVIGNKERKARKSSKDKTEDGPGPAKKRASAKSQRCSIPSSYEAEIVDDTFMSQESFVSHSDQDGHLDQSFRQGHNNETGAAGGTLTALSQLDQPTPAESVLREEPYIASEDDDDWW